MKVNKYLGQKQTFTIIYSTITLVLLYLLMGEEDQSTHYEHKVELGGAA